MVNENRIQPAADARQLSDSGYGANGVLSQQGGRRSSKGQGYDWLGALLRRKGILLFVLTVSGILGYLHFLRQPKVYASSLKLMIWNQAPPQIVDGEGAIAQPSSTGKHVHLLLSQVVLGNAAEKGDLRSLRTFAGQAEPMYALKGMLRVDQVDGAADTLVLTVKGPDPGDLPAILAAVVSSYKDIISEDAQALSKSSVELIEKLQEQMAENKSTNEERYRELVKKLGFTPDQTTGNFQNPYFAQLEEWRLLKSSSEKELRDVLNRIDGINDLDNLNVEERAPLRRVVAIEASRYLAIDMRSASGELTNEEERKSIEKWSERCEELENRIADLRLELTRIRRTVGGNHPSSARVAAEIELNTSKLTTQRDLVKRLEADLVKKSDSKKTNVTSSKDDDSSFEKDIVNWYMASLQRKAERLQISLKEYDEEIAKVEELAKGVSGEVEELNYLANEIQAKGKDMREILDKMSNLSLLASNYTSTKVRVIDSPGYGAQVEPRLINILAIFVMAGGLLGFGVVALLDWADLSYRNPSEIKDRLGLPVIARISKMSSSGKFSAGHAETLVTVDKPKSPVAEAYRACRTAMLFLARQQQLKTFLITSPAAGDGKSTTSLNLAMCFAQGGLRTVIVDADLRRPRCHAYLGLPPSPGLKDFSLGEASAENVVRATNLHQNLFVVTAGKYFSNPSQFIDSAQFRDFLYSLREQFDIVIIDSPPVLPVADAMSLSSIADGVLLVMKIRKGVVLSSEKACETLRSVNANILGVIVNQVEKMSHYSDYGKYGYNGYGGYAYYAGRYYGKANEKYYENESSKEGEPEQAE